MPIETRRMETSNITPKYMTLESLRGIAALFVTLFHFNFVAGDSKLPIIAEGDIFVDFFFVLSGFVIAHAYQNKIQNKLSFHDFFILRVARIYPLHIFMLFVWLLYILAKYFVHTMYGLGSDPTEHSNLYSFILNVVLLHSIGLLDSLSWNAPSWSISVELFAYLIFFAIVALFHKATGKVLFIALAVISYILLVSFAGETLLRTFDYGLLRCLGSFFVGAALRSWTRDISYNSLSKGNGFLEILSLMIMLFCVSQIKGSILFEFLSFMSFGLVIFIFSIQERGIVSKWLSSRFLIFLGKISYSIYMIHAIIAFATFDAAIYILKMPVIETASGGKLIYTPLAPLYMILYVAIVILISNYTYNWIEKPLRDRAKAWLIAKKQSAI